MLFKWVVLSIECEVELFNLGRLRSEADVEGVVRFGRNCMSQITQEVEAVILDHIEAGGGSD